MTQKPTALLEVNARWFTPEGRPTPEYYQYLKQNDRIIRLVVDFVDTPATPVSVELVDAIAGMIAFPANKDYRLVVKIPFDCTITETTTRSASGTCTATFKINTTALGGTANSVSSTENAQAHASANVVAAGDDIVMTISSNSSCLDMSFTIATLRTLVP